jgi:glycopeptide antibiotics resistance protein
VLDNWHDWVGTFTGVVATTVVALPLAGLAVGVLAWRRRAWRTALADVGMIYWTVPCVWMTLLPGDEPVAGEVILLPLSDLLTMDRGQIIGNLMIFAALGFFAPTRFAALASLRRVLLLAASWSALIEIAQYVLMLDRVSSVDDVLLNAAGAGLAALASRRWWHAPAEAGEHPEALHRAV